MRRPKPVYNVWDRLRSVYDPAGAYRTACERGAVEMATSHKVSDRSRKMLMNTHPGLGSANQDDLDELPRARELSRDAMRNQPLAVAAMRTMVAKVIGRGLAPQSQIDWEFLGLSQDDASSLQREFERLWRTWAWDSLRRCDAQRKLSFDPLASLAYSSERENGDSLIQWVRRSRVGWPFRLQAQLIEADRLSNPSDQWDGAPPPEPHPQTHEVWGGVEQTKSGMPVAYWIRQRHPGERNRLDGRWEWVRIPATNSQGEPVVSHVVDYRRIGASRGFPWLAPVIEVLKTLTEYSESEATAALISSFFTVWIESPLGDGLAPLTNTDAPDDEDNVELGAGIINGLRPGEKVGTTKMDRPNSGYGDFIKAQLRYIGAALGIPMEVLTKHFESSYSAARGALLEAWDTFLQERQRVIETVYRPAWEMLLTEAAAGGMVTVSPEFWTNPMVRSAYLGAEWIGPTQSQIDEGKAVRAAEDRIRIGISDRTTEAQKIGKDYERIVARQAQERRLREKHGVSEIELQPGAEPVTTADE